MALAELDAAGRTPQLPLILTLACGDLVIEQWLRVLPGKRYVARARFNNATRLVKLFVGARAEKKAREEATAIEKLTEAGILTPKLIDVGSESSNAAWLFVEFFEGCETLAVKAGLDVSSVSGRKEASGAATDAALALADLHNHELIHKDIHPGNILFYQQRCWLIDAADTAVSSDPLQLQANVGMFLAQLPRAWWPDVVQSYNTSAELAVDYDTVCAHAQRWQARRAADLAEKAVRDCSLFQVQQSMGEFCAIWRDQADWLQPLLNDLDGALASSVLLKDGASATVGLVEIAGRKVVIKRYNVKSFWHGLKRFWRPTRAWVSWQAGIRLRVLGVNTPKPLALKEERFGPFRKRGYLLVEASEGQDLLSLLTEESADEKSDLDENEALQTPALLSRVMPEIEQLLDIMRCHRISHGDFKATNLLWDETLCVIDLDSICWHSSDSSWQKAFSKDEARLLRNWKPDSQSYKYFKKVLQH